MLPAIFVSHGAPTLPLDPAPARAFLKELGTQLPQPRAILVVSAHWETDEPTVNAVAGNETIHDFFGFPDALYRLRYEAPGSPELALRTRGLLEQAGYRVATDMARGLDHGAWVPLMLAFPQAEIPVIQLSLQTPLGPAHHLKLGRALTALLAEDVLVMGSGSFTHNLRTMARGQLGAAEPEWSRAFSAWVHAALVEGRMEDLVRYRELAPAATTAHPTDEHFLPLFVALGAGGEAADVRRLHTSTTFGSLRMDAYAFSRRS
jgi:4,5-DOPA dioxygenase extradiol